MEKNVVSDKTIERLRSIVRHIKCGRTVGTATADTLIETLIDERGEMLYDLENLFDEIEKLQDEIWFKYLK